MRLNLVFAAVVRFVKSVFLLLFFFISSSLSIVEVFDLSATHGFVVIDKSNDDGGGGGTTTKTIEKI